MWFSGPVVLLLSSGCASVLNKGKQSLLIDTSPSGALVYENGAEVGHTPYAYTYDRTDGAAVTLELRQEGRMNKSFEVRPQRGNIVLFVDALLLNIPYYAGDAKSAALYTFPHDRFNVNLYKDMPDDVQKSDLPIVTMESRLAERDPIGHVGSKKVTTASPCASGLSFPDQFTSAIVGAMRDTYVEAHTVRLATQKGDEAVRKAKIYLRPVLKSVDMQLSEVNHLAYGKVNVQCEWKFMSGLAKDSVLFTYDRTTTYPVYAERTADVLMMAVTDAARQLMDEDGLRERLSKEFTAGLAMGKGQRIELAAPKAIPFSGRKEMLSALVKGVVTIETKNGHGSGFIVTNDGYLLTNAHVVEDQGSVKVRFQQGFSLDGAVMKVNRDFDVALIKVAGNDLPALTIGDAKALQLGEELFAIGTPLDKELGQTVTRGIMSGRREFDGRTFLQTDVSINPGNSGGPLIDENGKVVGVATLKIAEAGVQGIGFGVPMDKALEMLNIEFKN